VQSFSPDTLRILDAAANRASEGLRVLEDMARFTLDHAPLTGELKSIRHAVRTALQDAGVDPLAMIASRDTPHDVGTVIETKSEQTRVSHRDVIDAAAGRTAEALRSIEETLKLNPDASNEAKATESLRYRLYEAHKRLSLALGADRDGFRGWKLCVIITEALCRANWLETTRLAIIGGADCVQLREKTLSDSELLARATALVELAHPLGASVIINDRPDIALLAGADGVHVGQGDLDVESIRKVAGVQLLVGVSASTIEQAIEAHHNGADYCGVGAMFPTATKQKPSIAGPSLLTQYGAHTPTLPPPLAIGGINTDNIPELLEAANGARFGVAVSSDICGSEDPEAAARSIRQQLNTADRSANDPEQPCQSNSSTQPSTTG
jgi:thiamine-phosphate pyrophosphorylase